MDFGNYKAFKSMYLYMKCLADEYPNRVQLLTIGESFEGRPLIVLRIRGDQETNPRKSIWLDANIHSREWITSSSLLFFINQVVENNGHQINQELLNDFDYYIMPMANPDG